MIEYKNYTYINTTPELILTHNFEYYKSSHPFTDYKCKICGVKLFEQPDKTYSLFINGARTSLTCNEILIYKILL